MHFYKLFELKGVLAVCVRNHPTMIKNPPSVLTVCPCDVWHWFQPPRSHRQRHTATWSHSFSMESRRLPATRVTVGDGMWACQAMRVKRQKLRIAQLYANEQRISRATTNRSEGSVSGAHTSPSRVHARQDRFLERSHCFKWFDCNNIKMMHGK